MQQLGHPALFAPQCCDTMVTSPPKKGGKGWTRLLWLWILPSAVMSHHIPCAAIWSQIPSLPADLILQNQLQMLAFKCSSQEKSPQNNNKTQQQQTKPKKPSKGRIKDNPNPKGQNFCVWRTFSALMISYASCASQFLKVQVKSNEINSCTQPKTPELKETLLISLVTHSLPRSHVDMMLWMPHLSLH